MALFDEIRNFVLENYFKPARTRGETSLFVVSGEVHSGMNLVNRMPAVCNALRSMKPLIIYYIIHVKEVRLSTVKKDSSTNKFFFNLT